jgi:hypothetical protein
MRGNDVRRFLLLLALIILFVVLFLLNRSVASWQHTVISATPGELMYVASFDGSGTDGFNGDWAQYGGRNSAELSDGQMQVTVGELDSGIYSVAAPYFGDFDLRVEAQTLAGPIDNAYGVVFRLQNKDNTSPDDDSYYLFLVSADGYYRVVRVVDGGVPKLISDWIPSSLINLDLNAVNRLRVVARGDQFQFYINDQPVTLCIPNDPDALSTINPLTGDCMEGAMLDTLTDGSIANGQIGVSAQSTVSGGEGVVVGFDNLLIYALSAS